MAELNFGFLGTIAGQIRNYSILPLFEHSFLQSGCLLNAQFGGENPIMNTGERSVKITFFSTKLCLQSPLKDNSNKIKPSILNIDDKYLLILCIYLLGIIL